MKVAEEEFLLHGESTVRTNACVFFLKNTEGLARE